MNVNVIEFRVGQALNGADAVIDDLRALWLRLALTDPSIAAAEDACTDRDTLEARWARHLKVLAATVGRTNPALDRLQVPYWMLLVNVNRELRRHLQAGARPGSNTAEVNTCLQRWTDDFAAFRDSVSVIGLRPLSA